jgi:hypothetical protein
MSVVTSNTSAPVGNALIPTNGWLTNPQDTSTAVKLRRVGSIGSMTALSAPISFTDVTTEQMGVFNPLGRANAVIQRGVILAGPFTLNFLLQGYAEREALNILRRSGQTLLVRFDWGDAYYVVLGPDLPRSILRATDRLTTPYTVVSVNCTVTDSP